MGTAEGLDGAQGVAVSPDNANVYVVSPLRDTIAVFTRGAGGVLASTGCVKDPGSPASCAATALGLDGAADVAASPDGQNVYVVSQNPGSAVVAFERGAGGALTEINCVQNTGGAACGTAPGLNTPQALALSPDGLNLYVASFASDAVAWFARNRAPSCSGSTASTSAKTPVTVVLACSDPNGDPATRSIASGPARGTLGAIDQGAGRATYTPRAGFSGTDSFTFVGSDGGATSSPATVNLSVGSAPALRGLGWSEEIPSRLRPAATRPASANGCHHPLHSVRSCDGRVHVRAQTARQARWAKVSPPDTPLAAA